MIVVLTQLNKTKFFNHNLSGRFYSENHIMIQASKIFS